jgi:hypothetical protein
MCFARMPLIISPSVDFAVPQAGVDSAQGAKISIVGNLAILKLMASSTKPIPSLFSACQRSLRSLFATFFSKCLRLRPRR